MKISNCRCGRKAEADSSWDKSEYWVTCTRGECWFSPVRKTEREAIIAWNKVMGGKK